VVYFSTAASRRSRGGTWSIIAPPFIRFSEPAAEDDLAQPGIADVAAEQEGIA
jgi:hypothetical protein